MHRRDNALFSGGRTRDISGFRRPNNNAVPFASARRDIEQPSVVVVVLFGS